MIVLARTLLVLLAGALLFMAGQGPDSSGGRAAAGVGGGRDVPLLASPHIHLGERHRAYNTVPPTSGPHWADTVGTGVYREELPEEIQVHVLEHGHVLIQYSPRTPPREIRALERIGRRHLRDVVVAPYAKLTRYLARGEGIALTSWGRIDRVGHADEPSIERFIRAFSGRYNHGEWRGGRRAAAGAPAAR
jgi:hypothetical protein